LTHFFGFVQILSADPHYATGLRFMDFSILAVDCYLRFNRCYRVSFFFWLCWQNSSWVRLGLDDPPSYHSTLMQLDSSASFDFALQTTDGHEFELAKL
jgi:hypothetical protein